METRPTRRRLWHQYSLRALLFFMFLAAIALSWFGVKLQQARRQREAVEGIARLGGTVWYDYQDAGFDELPRPAWARELLGVDFLGEVVEAGVTADAGMSYLDAFPRLDVLRVNGTPLTGKVRRCLQGVKADDWIRRDSAQITDNGLAHVKGLSHLQELWLGGNPVTDAGVESVAGLTCLRVLELSGTQVTDAGLERLQGLTRLQRLLLDNSRVTDAGLKHLHHFSGLFLLTLDGSQVTDLGVTHLKKLHRRPFWLTLAGPQVTDASLKHLDRTIPIDELQLGGTAITDAGLEHLGKLTQVGCLNLNCTQVTDAGLKHLKGLSELGRLYLLGTRVTEEGVEELQQALPKCQITYRERAVSH